MFTIAYFLLAVSATALFTAALPPWLRWTLAVLLILSGFARASNRGK